MTNNINRKINNILIVDDEKDICYLVKSILRKETDAHIDICTSVKGALLKLKDQQYDLTFFDIRLNDGSGKDLAKFVANEVNYTPYIAFISAYTSYEDQQDLRSLNYDKFIEKPLSREKILNCLQEASQQLSI
jgi:two-component SAPR family response regulator